MNDFNANTLITHEFKSNDFKIALLVLQIESVNQISLRLITY
jgi:hypothetical protein